MPAQDQRLARRVARLEQRVSELEAERRSEQAPPTREDVIDQGPWALEGLKARTSGNGGVLFTGFVKLPTGSQFSWQDGTDLDSLLEADWTLAADVVSALGSPVRLTLMREILGGTETAAGLGALEGLGTTGQLYHHLRQLTAAGWLRTTGRGRYEIPAGRIVPLLVVLAAAQL